MNTTRIKIGTLRTLARQGFEPRSSGPQADMLTAMPCHFLYLYLDSTYAGRTCYDPKTRLVSVIRHPELGYPLNLKLFNKNNIF